MVSRIWIVNGFLAVALAACWINIWDVWQTDTDVQTAMLAAQKSQASKSFNAPPENGILSDTEYQGVVDHNLFSSERKAPSPETVKAKPVEDEVRVSGEKVMLYGVVLFDGYKAALIDNPGDQAKKIQTRWVKEGDRIANLRVQEIRQDQVILADGENSYRVLLYDPEKVRKASAAPKGSSSSQPEVVSVSDAPPAKDPDVRAVSPNPTKKSSEFIEKRTISKDGQYEIIDTPLGQIKRKRK